MLNFYKTLLLLPVEYYYHTLCEVSDISVMEKLIKKRFNTVPVQKMYNGENGIHVYFVDTFNRNCFAYVTDIFRLQLFASLVFPYTVIFFLLSFYFLPLYMPLLSIGLDHEIMCILGHSFRQNDHF